jgi:membrane protease subunit (stomatin/prohibitin family)
VIQQLHGICTTALAALQQSATPPAAAAAAAAPAEAAQQAEVSKMNFCNAVNSALHIAMATDPK